MGAEVEDEIEYITRDDVNIAILREIERINFREKLRRLMPMVAQELAAAGVDFSRVDFSKVTDATDSEIDQVFDDLLPRTISVEGCMNIPDAMIEAE